MKERRIKLIKKNFKLSNLTSFILVFALIMSLIPLNIFADSGSNTYEVIIFRTLKTQLQL